VPPDVDVNDEEPAYVVAFVKLYFEVNKFPDG